MDDLISRQAAIDHLKKRLYETALNNITEHPYYEEMADNRVSVWLEEIPAIDPVKHGKWIYEQHFRWGGYRCSECGTLRQHKKGMNYCPSCGARMERSEE